MKKHLKLFVVVTLIFTFLMSSYSFAGATSYTKRMFKNSNGKTVFVVIPNKYVKTLTDSEIKNIIESNLELSSLQIESVGYAEKASILSSTEIERAAVGGAVSYGPLVKKYTSTSVKESDRFVASVAKGQTVSITTTKTYSLSPSITGTIPSGSLGLNATISYSVVAGQTLTGPPETSTYNTREYRCAFYENRGTWSQVMTVYGDQMTRTGTFKEPVKYVSYSKDTNY